MSCKYCTNEYKAERIIDTTVDYGMSKKGNFWPGIEVYIEDDELWVESIADVYEPSQQDASTKINFCPMCGKQLREQLIDIEE